MYMSVPQQEDICSQFRTTTMEANIINARRPAVLMNIPLTPFHKLYNLYKKKDSIPLIENLFPLSVDNETSNGLNCEEPNDVNHGCRYVRTYQNFFSIYSLIFIFVSKYYVISVCRQIE